MTIPTAFESVGHIAHLNLRNEHAPYRHTIAQVRIVQLLHLDALIGWFAALLHWLIFELGLCLLCGVW